MDINNEESQIQFNQNNIKSKNKYNKGKSNQNTIVITMLFQNYNIDNKGSSVKKKVTQKNNQFVKSPYLEHRNDHTKYKEYLPRLSSKIKYRIDDPELAQISATKPYTSQPSKICKTEVSQQQKNLSTMYSQKYKIQLLKTKKTNGNKLWNSSTSCEKQPKSFNVTNNMFKIADDESQSQTNHKSDSKFKTHYQQHTISKIQQPERFSNSHYFRTQTFQENIIRNRLKIKSSLQVQEQNRFNSTLLVRNNQHYRTQLHELNDNRDEIGPSRLDTQSDFRNKNLGKKSIPNKQVDFSKLKHKNKKTNLYVPSFTHQKLTPTVIENLLKKIQLESQIKKYQIQTFGKQILFKIPEENLKLQKQIERIQLYFKKNKKQWFSHQLQKILQNQTQNLKGTELISKSKERSRSERIGKIVRQIANPIFDKQKQTENLYSDDRFEDAVKQSERDDGETVVLHDNSYRREIVQLDSSTEQNQTRMNAQSAKILLKMPSDQLIINAQDQLLINSNKPDFNNQSLKITMNERSNSTVSAKQRNFNNITKRKSENRDQCIIF